MKIFEIVLGLTLILCSIGIINAEGEIIKENTIYIDTNDIFISATPHTLYESGNVTFIIKTKKYNGDIDLIWGFNKATAKIKSIHYKNKKQKVMGKPDNEIVNKNHLLYKDKNQRIQSNQKVELTVWIDVNDFSDGKYDFIIKPSQLTIDEAKNSNQLWILDPWWDNSFRCKNLLSINNTGNPFIAMYQLNINISYNNNMQNDFDDIRFLFDDGTLISYWIEDYNDSNWCNMWFKVPYLLSNSWNNNSVTMYYNNSQVGNLSNINDTFIQAHENTSSSFIMPNICSFICILESKIYQPNTVSQSFIMLHNHQSSPDLAYIRLDNSQKMRAQLTDDGVGGGIDVVGVYNNLAKYKIVMNGTKGIFYINNIQEAILSMYYPNEYMGLTYTTVTNGYCEYAFVRQYAPYDATVYIGENKSLFLKYNSVTPVANIVLDDCQCSATSGINTKWLACAVDSDTYVIVNEYNNGTGEFEILNAGLKSFGVTGFIPGDLVYLSCENVFSKTGIINKYGEYNFISYLSPNIYSVEIKSYNNTTGVHGFIYEGISGSTIPLSEVNVYIYNSTWSDTTISDTGGYYVFTNLSNTTYTLNFKKDRYEEVLYQYVTPVNLSMYYKNIYMQKSTGDYYSRHYCTFILKNIFGGRYPNVNTIVYENDIIQETGITGYDGSIVFHLFEDIEYRITFINNSQDVSEQITVMPRDDRYIIWVGSFDFSPNNNTRLKNVNYWWIKNEINITTSWLNFSYKDTENKTTFIQYWINDTNNTNIYNTSQIYPCSGGVIYTVNQIVNSSNFTYVVHFSAEHPDYPQLKNSVVQTFCFYSKKLIDLLYSEQWQYTVVSLCIIIFIGTLFGATNAAQGSLIMILTAWFFSFIQWLPSSLVGYGALVLATLLAVSWNLRKSEIVHV